MAEDDTRVEVEADSGSSGAAQRVIERSVKGQPGSCEGGGSTEVSIHKVYADVQNSPNLAKMATMDPRSASSCTIWITCSTLPVSPSEAPNRRASSRRVVRRDALLRVDLVGRLGLSTSVTQLRLKPARWLSRATPNSRLMGECCCLAPTENATMWERRSAR